MSGCKSRCYPTHFNATLGLCQVYSFSFLEVLFAHIIENILDIRMNQWYNARSRKSLLAKEIAMVKVKFDDLKVGQKFVFAFDCLGTLYYWSYEKQLGNNVKCISSPMGSKQVGEIHHFRIGEEICYIIED